MTPGGQSHDPVLAEDPLTASVWPPPWFHVTSPLSLRVPRLLLPLDLDLAFVVHRPRCVVLEYGLTAAAGAADVWKPAVEQPRPRG